MTDRTPAEAAPRSAEALLADAVNQLRASLLRNSGSRHIIEKLHDAWAIVAAEREECAEHSRSFEADYKKLQARLDDEEMACCYVSGLCPHDRGTE